MKMAEKEAAAKKQKMMDAKKAEGGSSTGKADVAGKTTGKEAEER